MDNFYRMYSLVDHFGSILIVTKLRQYFEVKSIVKQLPHQTYPKIEIGELLSDYHLTLIFTSDNIKEVEERAMLEVL